MDNSLDRISYALGLSMGNNFQASGIKTINVKDFADGVAAVFEGAAPKMTYDEAKKEIKEPSSVPPPRRWARLTLPPERHSSKRTASVWR